MTGSAANLEILVSLGKLALGKGNRHEAIEYWQKALDAHVQDAGLLYRYALLAEEMALPLAELERALKAAIEIQNHFADARYKLALLESNNGEFTKAVEQLRAMGRPTPDRAFAYWTALA